MFSLICTNFAFYILWIYKESATWSYSLIIRLLFLIKLRIIYLINICQKPIRLLLIIINLARFYSFFSFSPKIFFTCIISLQSIIILILLFQRFILWLLTRWKLSYASVHCWIKSWFWWLIVIRLRTSNCRLRRSDCIDSTIFYFA
jgi:hypothetical protein